MTSEEIAQMETELFTMVHEIYNDPEYQKDYKKLCKEFQKQVDVLYAKYKAEYLQRERA